MARKLHFAPASGTQSPASSPRVPMEVRTFVRHAVPFVLVGLVLYGGLYAASERLIYQYAQHNRFYMVKTAPYAHYDHVILGASHAAVFAFEDMNARLEEMTRSRILNLSVVGGGVTVNRLLLEYFLAAHQTTSVVYVVDSFAFYSRRWNEDRLQDAGLFYRAPFDPALARLLLQSPAARSVALDYLVGFSKINNPDRFKPDIRAEESTRFNRTYRPVKQIDEQRIDYLYPKQIDEQVSWEYLAEFEKLIRYVKSRNLRFMVIKPPIPERVYRMIPNESQFDATLKEVLDRHGVEFHDFSSVSNDEKFFYDTDHLNRTGVLYFFENYLKGKLGDGAISYVDPKALSGIIHSLTYVPGGDECAGGRRPLGGRHLEVGPRHAGFVRRSRQAGSEPQDHADHAGPQRHRQSPPREDA